MELYGIFENNGDCVYIGRTNDVKRRKMEHRRRYDKERYEFKTLRTCSNETVAALMEIAYIKIMRLKYKLDNKNHNDEMYMHCVSDYLDVKRIYTIYRTKDWNGLYMDIIARRRFEYYIKDIKNMNSYWLRDSLANTKEQIRLEAKKRAEYIDRMCLRKRLGFRMY